MSNDLAGWVRLCAWRMENQGLFTAGQPEALSWGGDGATLAASWDGVQPVLSVVWSARGGVCRWTVKLVRSLRGRIYFICPISNERVLDLYVWDGSLGSRRALGLRYPSQQLSRDEWLLMKAWGSCLDDLGSAMPKRHYTRPPPAPPKEDKAVVYYRRQLEAQRENDEKDAERRRECEAICDLRAQHQGGCDPHSPAPLPGQSMAMSRFMGAARAVVEVSDYAPLDDSRLLVLEDLARIDLRAVAGVGHVELGARTAVQLCWKSQPDELQYAYLAIDLTDMGAPCAELAFGRWGETVRRQRLELIAQRGSARHPRFSFVLPGSRPAEVLVYRQGRFAPRRLQRLTHASQRATAAANEALALPWPIRVAA